MKSLLLLSNSISMLPSHDLFHMQLIPVSKLDFHINCSANAVKIDEDAEPVDFK